MEQTLNIKGIKLNLNFEPQLSPQGRPIRFSGISKNAKLPEKWVLATQTNGILKNEIRNHWIYTFRFIDDLDGFISFEFDYYDKFVGVVKH